MTAEPNSLTGRFRRRPRERWTQFAERIASAFGLVFLLVLATYVVTSLTGYVGWSAVAVATLGATSAAVAIGSAGARPRIVRSGFGVAIVVVVMAVMGEVVGSPPLLAAAGLVETLLLSVAAGAILRAVLGETEVGFRTILGAISVYLIFGLLFTSLYAAVDRLQPGPFFNVARLGTGDYIFFSFTTLTTTGYGSLVPVSQPGKMLAGLEMLLGQIFLVTLIAGLVSLWRPGSRLQARRRSDEEP
jgi:Ion channel